MKLQGKTAVVTGSGGGIGEACARRFVAEGASVVITDINAEAVERVSASLGTVGVAGDICDESVVREVAALARSTFGEVDIWYSNAGVAGPRQPGDLQSDELWTQGWNLHVMSHVYAARAVLPSMLERGDGYLLQTASVTGLSMQFEKATYTVSKHAAVALGEWLAATYRPKGIKVSCFCPGPMLTPMLLSNNFPDDHPVLSIALTPEQVAEVIVNGIDAERFLIAESPSALDSLTERVADYDAWLASSSQPPI